MTAAETEWKTKQLAPVQAQNTEYVRRLTEVGKVEHVMFNEPEQFLDILRTIPAYEGKLPPKGSAGAARGAAGAADVMADTELGAMPGPDVNVNGQQGYSPEGLQKLLDWTARKATQNAIRETEERLGKRFGPMEQAFKSTRERLAADQKINQTLDAAFAWPRFKDFQNEILDVMVADTAGKLTLSDAYHQVLHSKLTKATEDAAAVEARVRKQILDEMKDAPASTSAGGGSAVRGGAPAGPSSLEDIIRASIRR